MNFKKIIFVSISLLLTSNLFGMANLTQAVQWASMQASQNGCCTNDTANMIQAGSIGFAAGFGTYKTAESCLPTAARYCPPIAPHQNEIMCAATVGAFLLAGGKAYYFEQDKQDAVQKLRKAYEDNEILKKAAENKLNLVEQTLNNKLTLIGQALNNMRNESTKKQEALSDQAKKLEDQAFAMKKEIEGMKATIKTSQENQMSILQAIEKVSPALRETIKIGDLPAPEPQSMGNAIKISGSVIYDSASAQAAATKKAITDSASGAYNSAANTAAAAACATKEKFTNAADSLSSAASVAKSTLVDKTSSILGSLGLKQRPNAANPEKNSN